MFRIRAAATCIALAVTAGGATAALAPSALASASHTSAVSASGAFHAWPAAQKAAGFKLKKPTKVHGLSQSGAIDVSNCLLARKPGKHVVDASYGRLGHGQLALEQNNSGGRCMNLGHARSLGTVKIGKVTAHWWANCGRKGELSCSSNKIVRYLTWKVGSNFYISSSQNESKATLVTFSRSLHSV